MRVLVVVSDLEDLPADAGPRVSAEAFLAGQVEAPEPDTVVNLCRSWRYLSDGYYVSLLAEARGQGVFPSPSTIVGIRNPRLVLRALDEAGVATVEPQGALPAAIAPDLAGEGETVLVRDQSEGRPIYRPATELESAEVVACFGRCANPSFRRLAGAVYRVWPAPLLELSLLRVEGRWRVLHVRPLGLAELDQEQRLELVRQLRERPPRPVAPRKRPRASLAVLFDEADPCQPSSPETLERFERIAARQGLHVARIGLHEVGRLGEFDALLVRTLTGPDLPSFGFALQAEALGMPTLDDTASILRCCNKVYLHELLERGGVATPATRVFGRAASWGELTRELGEPLIVKVPDGSFSSGVFKLKSAEEFEARVGALLERSPLLLAQRFVPTAFDWRVAVLGGELLFACRYYMARGHWQIASATRGGTRYGRVEAVPLGSAPPAVLSAARQAAALVGEGFYGVDLKELEPGEVVVMEVNDNPNLDLGYEDAAEGDRVYEALAQHFLTRIQSGFRKPPPPRRSAQEEALAAWRTPIEARDEARVEPPYAAFGVCGIELEYAVVDRDLNAASLVEPALALLAGRPTSEVTLGVVGLTNEITDHVLELRTEDPLVSLVETERVLLEGVRRLGALLAGRFRGARLLPAAMHPWLEPAKAKLWRRSNRKIYGTYERLFDTATHGWRNVQACHVNLPLGSEEEAVALMNAAALLVPYLPALAASSPLVEGELGPAVDNRVSHLLTHQVKIPESQGELVPEFTTSLKAYRRDVLGVMYQAVDRLPDAGPIRREYLNARGAVFKFSRESLEVRIVDMQECVHADVALAAFVRWALADLSRQLLAGELALPDHALLVADLHATAERGSAARVHAPFLDLAERDAEGQAPVQAALAALLAGARRCASPAEVPYLDLVERIRAAGSLSERIAAALRPYEADEDAFTEAARRLYIELADCLLDNRPWRGRFEPWPGRATSA